MKKSSIYVEVNVPINDTCAAMTIISRLLKKNNIHMNLSIAYDYEMMECGVYIPFEKEQYYRIFVNPLNCKTDDDIYNQENSKDDEEPYAPGYCADITIFGVTIHEFCHLLQYRVYPTIIKDYENNFPTERFNLNGYSNNELHDELAEIMTLYITNPYLLKLISKPHWNFCKNFFKSPIPCSSSRCTFIYMGWPVIVKEHLKKKWGIVFNVATEKFERCNDGKTN